MLSFEDNAVRTGHTGHFLPKVEMKDCNVMVNGRKLFDHPVKNDIRTFGNIRKIATGQGDGYSASCLLDYAYFKENYKLIAIDLSKQEAVDADPKAIPQTNFTENLERAGNVTMFFILEKVK